ncbi:PIG-L deacetylase family protein [Nocardioides sp. URHA0020]|uniref:PIG-L deacetylase family protein n=1 Tax=Nocardioides sp. URHA0020 TaxID=1380392 RepID=UPI0004918945|nr:PIG-L family deacetylase [Nocardioides sp. URHA0020]
MNPDRFTLVSFHAHPDDEALLTAGTLARATAEGHRVVLVVATAGGAGLASPHEQADLAERRTRELAASAAALGIARVEVLGYADSRFAEVALDEAADRLADILRVERADVLTTYDEAGGYGHPDHVQVHRVGRRAAELAGTAVVLEATLDRGLIDRLVRTLRQLSRVVPMPELPDMSHAYTARADLTHEVDVRAHLAAKLASLRAHATQVGGGDKPRTLALLLRLPRPLARSVLGREWFREVGRRPGPRLEDDIFATLRAAPHGAR